LKFNEKLNLILIILNCSNIEIAKISGIDASIVSRFRTGARIPRANSTLFIKLCNGIVRYAQNSFRWEVIKETCKIIDNGNPENEISTYLLPEDSREIGKIKIQKEQSTASHFFGEKLNVLMNMLSISNIRLARAINVDSSLISRFRKGLRTPIKNSKLTMDLCQYLYKKVLAEGLEDELSELINFPKKSKNDDNILMIAFIDWISYRTEEENTGAVDSLLEKMDSYTISKSLNLLPLNMILDSDIFSENNSVYFGIDGFHKAIIRFLGSVATLEKACNLKLYSDQNLDWLVTAPAFMKQWAALMHTVLLKKNQIQIIHNIDRNLTEMLAAIDNWMPLYMTGMIEAFYCERDGELKFAHTLFVAPQFASIHANLIVGTENKGKYQYINSSEDIIYYEEQFDALLKISKPLVKVFTYKNIEEYHFRIGEMAKHGGTSKKLLISLSIATMPSTLLERILTRNEIPPKKIEKILRLHDTRIRQLKKELQSGSVIEYVALPDDEALLSGDVKLNLSDLFLDQTIAYTSFEYSEHISSLVSWLKENDNYTFVPLPASPFEHIQIMLKSDTGVMVLKSVVPSTAFWFGHPKMCRAFDEYLDVIDENGWRSINNRNNLFSILEKYIL